MLPLPKTCKTTLPEEEKKETPSFLSQLSSTFAFPDYRTEVSTIAKQSLPKRYSRYFEFLNDNHYKHNEWRTILHRAQELSKIFPGNPHLKKIMMGISHADDKDFFNYLHRTDALLFTKRIVLTALYNATIDYFRCILAETDNQPPLSRQSKINELNTYLGIIFTVNAEGKVCPPTCRCPPTCGCNCHTLSETDSLEKFERVINQTLKKIINATPFYSRSSKLEFLSNRLQRASQIIQDALREHFSEKEILDLYDDKNEIPIYFTHNLFHWNISQLEKHPPQTRPLIMLSAPKIIEELNDLLTETAYFATRINEPALKKIETCIMKFSLDERFHELRKRIHAAIDLAMLVKNIKTWELDEITVTTLQIDCIEVTCYLKSEVHKTQHTIHSNSTNCFILIENKIKSFIINMKNKIQEIDIINKTLNNEKTLLEYFPDEYKIHSQALNEEKLGLQSLLNKAPIIDRKNEGNPEYIANLISQYEALLNKKLSIQDSVQPSKRMLDSYYDFMENYQKRHCMLHSSISSQFRDDIQNDIKLRSLSLKDAAKNTDKIFQHYLNNVHPLIPADIIIEQNENPESQFLIRTYQRCMLYKNELKRNNDYQRIEEESKSIQLTYAPNKIQLKHKFKAITNLEETAASAIQNGSSQECVHQAFTAIQKMVFDGIESEVLSSHRDYLPNLFSCCLPTTFFAPKSDRTLLQPIKEDLQKTLLCHPALKDAQG
ncbi:MAG: hypothetical protein SFW66_01880 [Gammaproteobacteria bacterium]|nr:hypothetical protein [Gammaproteobacteria bacterium]